MYKLRTLDHFEKIESQFLTVLHFVYACQNAFTNDRALRLSRNQSTAQHAFCNLFQLQNLILFKTIIIEVTENQEQYIDDITEKKHSKGENRYREKEKEREKERE